MASRGSLSASLKRKAKRQKWLPLLLRFLEELRIQSKEVPSIDDERGGSRLELWDSQKMFLETLCDGLEEGVHEFYYLKSRQLGLTTLGLAIILFWLAINPRMIGCIVADTDANSMGFREQLNTIMRSFPPDFIGEDFTVTGNNKNFMTFINGSRLDFLVAGKNKENWAESKGYALAWASEVGKYGKQEGIDSFRETLSQTHPNRLFIFESTANGFANAWHDMWLAAGDDPFTKRRRFIGWWAKPANMIPRKDPRFDIYGRHPPNGEEAEKISQVSTQYDHVVTLEQLAWYRWRSADKSAAEGTLEQNQPFTESEAFVQPGFSFFQMRLVQRVYDSILENPPAFAGYRFLLGTDIFSTRMEEITEQAEIDRVELRVWEEPKSEGIYVIGCDPAYGRTDWADRHGINVFRAFADKLVQVAEYNTDEVETHHCAWVLAYLAGAYRNCVINLEIGGPGRAILREFDQLRDRMKAEVYAARVRDLEWDDFLDQARWYLYHRPDSPGPGFAFNFETTWRSKMEIMNQMRDSFTTDIFELRSLGLLDEMSTMVQTRSDIAPSGQGRKKDDRVFSAALANRAWIDQLRNRLLQEGATYEAVTLSEAGELSVTQQMIKRMVYDFFRTANERAEMPHEPTFLEDRGLG
jgi:hypothetical protein